MSRDMISLSVVRRVQQNVTHRFIARVHAHWLKRFQGQRSTVNGHIRQIHFPAEKYRSTVGAVEELWLCLCLWRGTYFYRRANWSETRGHQTEPRSHQIQSHSMPPARWPCFEARCSCNSDRCQSTNNPSLFSRRFTRLRLSNADNDNGFQRLATSEQ